MSTPNLRPLLTTGLVLGLLMGAGFWYTQILPLNQKAANLAADIKRTERDRLSAQSRIALQGEQLKSVVEEIQKLKEFDLRRDDPFDVIFANRSNRGLIAVTNLLEKHAIGIETLSAATVDQHPITIGGVPQGGVLTRKYRILAQGDYADVQAAFAEMSKLPPTVVFESYDVEALPVDGQPRARVAFEIEFGFNFLVSQTQFDAFTALASDSVEASGSLASALFDGSLARTIQDRALSIFGQSDTTDTVPASGSLEPEPDGSAASGSNVISRWLSPIESWLVPAAEAKTETAPRRDRSYTFGEQRSSQIGRKEPFLPLVQRTPKPRRKIVTASGSVLPAGDDAIEEPMPVISLEGVLLSPGGPATAFMSFDGQRLRVRPGSVLVDGSQVEAIGRDFLLLRRKGQILRIGLGSSPASPPVRPVVGKTSFDASVNLPSTQDVSLPPPLPRVRPQP